MEEKTQNILEEKNILQAIMDNIPVGILIADAPGVKVRAVNKYAVDLTGYPAEGIIGVNIENQLQFWKVFHTDGTPYKTEELPLVRAALKGETIIEEEGIIERNDGVKIPIIVSAGPVRDEEGNIVAGVSGWQDISKLKQDEEIISRDRDKLRLLVEKITRELDQTKHLTELGNIANRVVHEMRNPLAAILTSTYNIKRKSRDKRIEKHIFRIEKKVSEASQIINNLLFYSKIHIPGKKPADLMRIIAGCADEIRKQDKKCYNSLKNNISGKKLIAEVDKVQIRQVINNIIGNACDAVRETGEKITINAFREGKNAVISIEDHGMGMPEEVLQKCTEPFFTTKAKGVGLGLSIAKIIVELHGGNLELKSKEGRGVKVRITLPLKP